MTKILPINTDTPNVLRGPSVGIKGEMRAVLLNPDGSIAQDNGWQPNKILDLGLTYMGMESFWSYGHVGSSNAAVVTTQTGLQSHITGGYSSNRTAIDISTKATAPNWESYNIYKYRFDPGVGTGTIREFGIGHQTANSLTTRVLVSPDMVKSSIQTLDIYYKLTVYPDLTTYSGTIDMIEDGFTVPYNVIARGQNYGHYETRTMNLRLSKLSGNIDRRFMDGNIGATVNAYPAGTTAGGFPNYLGTGYIETGPYGQAFRIGVTDSAYKDLYISGTLDTGNISSGLGIRSVYMDWDIGYGWGVQYNRVSDGGRIQKDNTKIIQMNYRFTWTRL